jgi:predicted AAA+ superfamily ATPase
MDLTLSKVSEYISNFKQLVEDQGKEKLAVADRPFVLRTAHAEAKALLEDPWIKVVLGVRRSGKSVFCHQILSGRSYSYLNFDDERLIGLKAKDLNPILQALLEHNGSKPEFLFFDEIQNVEGW